MKRLGNPDLQGIWKPNPAEVVRPDLTYCISATDGRYFDPEVAAYFSPYGELKAHLRVEIALIQALYVRRICTSSDVQSVIRACRQVTAQQVHETENKPGGTQHDIDALVACIRQPLNEAIRSLVHRGGTSFDIRCTGDAMRYKAATLDVVIPALLKLEQVLVSMTLREMNTVQKGRTHLQDAVPITLGFGMAEYVYRLMDTIINLKRLANLLKGKFAGAAGTMASIGVVIVDPISFEREVLAYVGLEPSPYSNQIVPSEDVVRLMDELVIAMGVMNNLADDIRILLSSAYGELLLELAEGATGSTAMPQKVNPKDFENVNSMYRCVLPRIITPHLNLESNLQRDLRDSAASRTYGETFLYITSSAKRLASKMPRLVVNYSRLEASLEASGGMILAEAYNALLAKHGHPTPHGKMKAIAKLARAEGITLIEAARRDPELAEYFDLMDDEERGMLTDPRKYIGVAPERARRIAVTAAETLGLEAIAA